MQIPHRQAKAWKKHSVDALVREGLVPAGAEGLQVGSKAPVLAHGKAPRPDDREQVALALVPQRRQDHAPNQRAEKVGQVRELLELSVEISELFALESLDRRGAASIVSSGSSRGSRRRDQFVLVSS